MLSELAAAFDWSWITVTPTAALMVVLSGLGIYAALVLFTRLTGLRSFSKMSSFDFAITVAFGTVLAGTLYAKTPTLVQGIIAMATLYVIQLVVSWLRPRSEAVNTTVDNDPLLLMAGEEILWDHLKAARMTEGDLHGKLREANVMDYHQVRAVVMEATGDVSVLHASEGSPDLNAKLLSGVRGVEHLKGKPGIKE